MMFMAYVSIVKYNPAIVYRSFRHVVCQSRSDENWNQVHLIDKLGYTSNSIAGVYSIYTNPLSGPEQDILYRWINEINIV